MATDNKINLPGGFGGLMRFNEEYPSLFNLKPIHIISFVVLIIGLRILLEFMY